jgi:hypothetical protein
MVCYRALPLSGRWFLYLHREGGRGSEECGLEGELTAWQIVYRHEKTSTAMVLVVASFKFEHLLQ